MTIPLDQSTAPKQFCLVLMPFREELDEIYKSGIEAACDLTKRAYCERLDRVNFKDRWLDHLFSQIAIADLIIAEMTDHNPNVFYEVGYAHALNRPVIPLVKKGTDIPADLRPHQHIAYTDAADLAEKLASRIEWYLDVGNKGTSQFQNEFAVSINGQQIHSSKSSDENGRFTGGIGLSVVVQNISSHPIESSDFRVLLVMPKHVHIHSSLKSRTDPVMIAEDRFQYILKPSARLLPGEPWNDVMHIVRSAHDTFSAVESSIRILTTRGPLDFPISIQCETPDGEAAIYTSRGQK